MDFVESVDNLGNTDILILFVIYQHSCSAAKSRLTLQPHTAAHQASLSCAVSWSPQKLMSIESLMPSNHLVLCCLLLLPSVFPSIRIFSNELALHIKWLKYWSFNFHISPSIDYLGLGFFRIDWFNLFVVQGTLKSLLQHHNSKVSVLGCSAYFVA